MSDDHLMLPSLFTRADSCMDLKFTEQTSDFSALSQRTRFIALRLFPQAFLSRRVIVKNIFRCRLADGKLIE